MLARPRPSAPMTAAHRNAIRRAFHIAVLAIGCAGFAAIWTLLAAGTGSTLSALAVVAAVDAALLLRLIRARPGWARAAAGGSVTAVIIVLAQWGVIAAHVGSMLGLPPWESALRMGPSLAWAMAGVAMTGVDLAWFAASLVVAAALSR